MRRERDPQSAHWRPQDMVPGQPGPEALPQLYAARTRGGLQHIRISGGPTRRRFLAWMVEYYDDMARSFFELERNENRVGEPVLPPAHAMRRAQR